MTSGMVRFCMYKTHGCDYFVTGNNYSRNIGRHERNSCVYNPRHPLFCTSQNNNGTSANVSTIPPLDASSIPAPNITSSIASDMPTTGVSTLPVPSITTSIVNKTPTTGASYDRAPDNAVVRQKYDASSFTMNDVCTHEYLPLSLQEPYCNYVYLLDMGVLENIAFKSPGKTNRGSKRKSEHDVNIPTGQVELYISTGKFCPDVIEKAMMNHPLAQARKVDVYVKNQQRMGVFGCETEEQDDVVSKIVDDVVMEHSDIIEEVVYKGVTKKFEKKERVELALKLEEEKTKQEIEKTKQETKKAKQEVEKTKQLTLQIQLEKLKMAQGNR